MTYIRAFAFAIFLYVGTLIIGLVCSPLLLASHKTNVKFIRWWTSWILGGFRIIVGVNVVLKGRENLPEGPVLLASKHQAMWETMFLYRLTEDAAVVLKQELMSIPIFGWWNKKLKMIAIQREAHAAALKAMMRDAKAATDAGRSLIIFPEGTRAIPGETNEYKSGVFALYRAMKRPCVPIALNSGRCWPKSGIGFKPGTITVEILPPIEPGLDRDTFMTELETRIETATNRLLTT